MIYCHFRDGQLDESTQTAFAKVGVFLLATRLYSRDDLTEYAIAGGFLRQWYDGIASPDVDLFCRTRESFDSMVDHLGKQPSAETTIKSKSLVEVKIGIFKVDVVFSEGLFDTVDQLVESIDFDACGIAWDSSSNCIVHTENFIRHATARILNYTGSARPASSLKRAIKFATRGYMVTDEGLDRLIADLRKNESPGYIEYEREPGDEYDPFADDKAAA